MSVTSNSFASLWKKFYAKGMKVLVDFRLQQQMNNPCSNYRDDKVKVLLQSLTALLLGLDDQKKVFAVSHGALEMIVKCMTNNSSLAVRKIGLKAITTCVARNPGGRANCRQAGVFRVLSIIFNTSSMEEANQMNPNDSDDMEILEETMNTLAAVCLGDSLNALQATVLYKATVASAVTRAPLNQKLAYLQALMKTMETEQKRLLDSYCDGDSTGLFETIETAELCVLEGIQKQRCQQWREAETLYTTALTDTNGIVKHTTLLNDFIVNIRDNRSSTRLKRMDWIGALADIDACLQQQDSTTAVQLPSTRISALHSRRVDALRELGRLPEALKALGRALETNNPRDAVLLRKMNQLQLQQQRQSSSCNKHHQHYSMSRRQLSQNSTYVVQLESWLAALPWKRYVSDNTRRHTREKSRRGRRQQQQYDAIITTVVGTSVKSIYGTGIVQEVRKCGLTKIQIESWLLVGGQKPTAYLMPECYSIM